MKTMSFFTKIFNYFTNPKYYLSTTFKPLSDNIKMLLIVLVSLSLVWSVIKSVQDIPILIEHSKKLVNDVVAHYPEDLQFEWDGDSFQYSYTDTASQPEVGLSIPFSSVLPEFPDSLPNNFAYIVNTTQTPEELDISSSEYLLFANSKEIYTSSDVVNSNWEATPFSEFLSDVDAFALNKNDFIFVSNTFIEIITQNKLLIQVAYFLLLIPFFILNKIWILLVESLFVILFFKIYGMKLTVKQTLSLTISVFIPTSIIATVANILYGPLSFPLNTVAFWVVLLFILYTQKKTAIVQVRKTQKE